MNNSDHKHDSNTEENPIIEEESVVAEQIDTDSESDHADNVDDSSVNDSTIEQESEDLSTAESTTIPEDSSDSNLESEDALPAPELEESEDLSSEEVGIVSLEEPSDTETTETTHDEKEHEKIPLFSESVESDQHSLLDETDDDFWIGEDDIIFTNPEPEKQKKTSKLRQFAFIGKKSSDTDASSEAIIQKDEKRKKLYIILGSLAALLLIIYAAGVFYFQNKFLPNTYVNGASISMMTLPEAEELVSSLPQERKVEIIGKDGVKSEVQASDVGYVLTETANLEQTLANQNPFSWPLHLFKNFADNTANDSTINEEALRNTVANLEIVAGPQVVKTENARAEYNGSEFVVRDEVWGTEVDVPKLIENVRQSIFDGNPMINLEEEQNYVMPVTLKDSEVLAKSVEQLNSILNTVVTYDFKTSQEVVDKNVFLPWLGTAETGEARVNPQLAAAYISDMAAKYDTYGKPVNFVTSGGQTIGVYDYVKEGWQINQAQELTDLSNNILNGETVVKEPAYSKTGRDRATNNTISGTYLEISIPDQTMWYYQNGQPVVQTSVVTGDPTAGHSTPSGLFDVQSKEMYVTLTGPGYASPVTFWIPFDGGVGVHDASWRGSYGGSIYRGNGSHGCVNTPYSAVRTIYNSINVGEPVVVYD